MSGRPVLCPPRLNDPLVLDQFDIDAAQMLSPSGKAAADLGIDFGGRPGKRRMFLGIHQRPIDRARRRIERTICRICLVAAIGLTSWSDMPRSPGCDRADA